MKIKNRIYKSELVEWEKVNDLQPELLKEHYNISHLRKSILKYGVSKAYDICEIEGELYWLDGHTRTEMFRTLQSEGIEIPKMLMANFCEVKNRQEAISILLEVHNIKHDPINAEVLTEWVNIEQVEVEVTSLNVVDIKDISDSDEFGTDFSLPDGDKAPFQQMTFTLADEQAEQIKNAISDIKQTEEYKYAETMGNENSNGNALYLIIMQWAEQRK